MAIDLTDIAADPELLSQYSLSCLRRPRTTSDGGLAVITTNAFTIWATVAPANGRQLHRLAEADRTAAGIAVYTTTQLIAEAPGFAADIVYWKTQPYLVAYVDDFSTNGFCAAVCTLTDVVGPLPDTPSN